MRLLFVAAVTGAAFLLFLVQPMVGKRILPWFGGAPSVWTLCLAFYQSALFLGYAYAHLLIRFAAPRVQLVVHTLAVVIAALALPVLPGDGWLPREGSTPGLEIGRILTANVALPFLVLASTGPLVQAWFTRRYPERSPYPLYAFSNAGSLAALLAYPFAIEASLTLSRTGALWSWGFTAVALLMIACVVLAQGAGPDPGGPVAAPTSESGSRHRTLEPLFWLLASASAVVLLMGVTNELCVDIASVPFLWILPLTTYLSTFVLCFGWESVYRRIPFAALTAIAFFASVGLDVWVEWLEPASRAVWESPVVQIIGFCGLLFGACMILHGELYRLRPPSDRLTSFYLAISGGGALGGLFVGVVAPAIFDDFYELHTGLGLGALLFVAVCAIDLRGSPASATPPWRWAAVGGVALALLAHATWTTRSIDTVLHRERSFFGVYRVFEERRDRDVMHRLQNGTTTHGTQMLGEYRWVPTTYYGRATGLGLVMAQREPAPGTRIGVVGLGIGTLATYTAPGELLRFYEIDPAVVRIARNEGLFHFLEDCPAEVEIVVGDGRLALADEQRRGTPQAFDYLVVDAFSSDAIPVHLLTVEAFAHYAAALSPEGLLAIHASNRHFDLMPLVARVGREVGLHSLRMVNRVAPRYQSIGSHWMWLSRDPERLRDLAARVRARRESLELGADDVELAAGGAGWGRDHPGEEPAVWTDDYSDLFGVLRRGSGTDGTSSTRSTGKH